MVNEVKDPAVSYQKRFMTEEEYLAMEEQSEEKHEWYQGKYLQWRALQYRIISSSVIFS